MLPSPNGENNDGSWRQNFGKIHGEKRKINFQIITAMNLNDFMILVINLDRAPLRLQKISEQLNRLGLSLGAIDCGGWSFIVFK